ncbi:unnamed protein product [Didymodactylos carnosus]|uniref:Cytochrome b-245 light chain n=1 Tax=Didymodactylos carnosus TaxID=1234261 RepID=A0A813Y856_9BILA|nr:unnamed protein product [Didymodactylos carnosus]CAF1483583.1 unnamed protein product [Didymodactylos carnosus]CAF3666644.1 unnamed protein product [Didymodactylos carnosus]CAF4273785.1 unnamed protein product [Didymodactylos carnosus]
MNSMMSTTPLKIPVTEWAMWANEHVLLTGYVLGLFSILEISFQFSLWPIGIYSLILSIALIVFEYPRSRKFVGKARPRRWQQFPTAILKRLGPFSRNYFFRFVAYVLLSIPCFLLISTFVPATSLVFGAFIYGVAALYHERWKPVEIVDVNDQQNLIQGVQSPTRPPPREPIYNQI